MGNPQNNEVVRAVREGRLSRRELVLRASTAGMAAPAIMGLLAATAPGALAQEATPGAEAVPGLEPLEELPADGLAEAQTFRFGFDPPLIHFDPAQEAGYARWIIPLVFTPLFQFQGAGNDPSDVLPGLCLSYDVSEDGLAYTLHVDPAAVWTDGSKVTASDLKGWMEYISSPANPGPYKTTLDGVAGYAEVNAGEAEEMSGLVAVDDETLTIELAQANPLFPIAVLFEYRLGGTKPDVAKANPEGWWLDNPPSNGPFMIDSLDFDANEYSFVPNPAWWRAAPTISRIEAFGGVDQQTLMLMFENGQVDAMFVFGEEAIQMEINHPEAVQPMPGAGGMFFWALNVNLEPTNDLNVRKALRHAVDVPGIAQAVYQGQRTAGRGPIWQQDIVGSRFDEIEGLHEFFTFDPALATQELAESSYGAAASLPVLNITTGGTASDKVRATEIMVEMWRTNLGVNSIDIREAPDAFGDQLPAETVNVLRISGGGIPDAAQLLKNFAYSTSALPLQFMGGYSNPELDTLIDTAYFMDRADPAYVEAVHEIEDLYLNDYTYVPLMVDPYSYYVQPWVKNVRANRHNVIYTLTDVFLLPQE